jgi:hypothetical protein
LARRRDCRKDAAHDLYTLRLALIAHTLSYMVIRSLWKWS